MHLEAISTGGGFSALYMEHPLGRAKAGYFLISTLANDTIPNKGDECILGWYKDDGEFIDSTDIIF